MSESVCLFVCLFICLYVHSITQKRKFPKCSNLVKGMTLEYSRNDMVLGFQGHKLGLGLGQQQYGMGSDSMSAF